MRRWMLLSILLAGLLPHSAWAESVLNIYSARIEKLVKPAFDLFTEKTGIVVKLLTASEAELLERLKAEGKHTPADILITVDAGNLWLAEEAELLHPVQSSVLNANVPAHLRDAEGNWYGLTIRARTIVYKKGKVKPEELSTYAALGDAKWKNRLCLRTSKKVYNISLVGTMIQSLGTEKTKNILAGWMNNHPVIHAKDSQVLKAIAAGQCDVGLVNTYYLGQELKEDPAFPVALFWANQKEQGTHVNISGAGVVRHAKHRQEAIQLLEFLSSVEAQNLFVDENMEYPVNPKVSPSPELQKWWGASFKQDTVAIEAAGKNQAAAVRLMAQVGYK